MSKILTIMIPTLPGRIATYARLVTEINRQVIELSLENHVQVISKMDTREMSIGAKRNAMLADAIGRYALSADDDDMIERNYMEMIVKACMLNRDVVTFRGDYVEDNKWTEFIIRHGIENKNDMDKKILWRKPNHLCAVRTEIAKRVGFEDMQYGEDDKYAEGISKLIKTEAHIDEKLYTYFFNAKNSQTAQTGLKNPFK